MSLSAPTVLDRLAWRLQVFGYDLFAALLRRLPVDAASDFGGWLMRRLGPATPADGRIRRNLELAFPEMSQAERDRIRIQHWERFGRFVAEFPMIDRLTVANGRVRIVGRERLEAIAASGEPAILISGHFSNFEVMAYAILQCGVKAIVSYRPANNPYFDARVVSARARYGLVSLAPKGAEGALAMTRALRRGESVTFLVDQKFNSGVEAPLFGRMVRVNPGAVRLARFAGGRLIPLSIRRLEGARFEVEVFDAIELPRTGDRERDIVEGAALMNAFLEARIRAHPEEWFWAHRRWPKDLY